MGNKWGRKKGFKIWSMLMLHISKLKFLMYIFRGFWRILKRSFDGKCKWREEALLYVSLNLPNLIQQTRTVHMGYFGNRYGQKEYQAAVWGSNWEAPGLVVGFSSMENLPKGYVEGLPTVSKRTDLLEFRLNGNVCTEPPRGMWEFPSFAWPTNQTNYFLLG